MEELYKKLTRRLEKQVEDLIEICERRQGFIENCIKLIDKQSQINDKLTKIGFRLKLEHLIYLRRISYKFRMNVRRQAANTYWCNMINIVNKLIKSDMKFRMMEYWYTNNARIQIRQLVRHSVPYQFIEKIRKDIKKLENEIKISSQMNKPQEARKPSSMSEPMKGRKPSIKSESKANLNTSKKRSKP